MGREAPPKVESVQRRRRLPIARDRCQKEGGARNRGGEGSKAVLPLYDSRVGRP